MSNFMKMTVQSPCRHYLYINETCNKQQANLQETKKKKL